MASWVTLSGIHTAEAYSMPSLTKYRRQKGRVSPTEGSALWRRVYGAGLCQYEEGRCSGSLKASRGEGKNAGRDKNLSASERVLLGG